MKKIHHILAVICLLAFTSCQSLGVITLDLLMPGDLNFPTDIRRVGIVNNVNINAPDQPQPLAGDTTRTIFDLARKVTFHDGDSWLTTESLAEAIAEANYFDEVIISDSMLRANDKNIRETVLSREEVTSLTSELDVDMIIALENIQIKAIRTVGYYIDGGYLGTVEARIHPSISLYLASRNGPFALINVSDTLFWEDVFPTQVRAQTQVVSDSNMIEEASIQAGIIPVKHIVPYWKTVERYFFNSGKSDMKDAALFARRGSWDEAFKLWERLHQQSRNKRDQMMTAFNIALYHETTDNLDQAIAWAEKALALAEETGRANEYVIVYSYLHVLKKREESNVRLRIQMQRFEDIETRINAD